MEMQTYAEMNEHIKDILILSGSPVHIYAAKRIEELEKEREEHLKLIGQVKTEMDEFMSLLEITFDSHPSVVDKAKEFNVVIRRHREALEYIAGVSLDKRCEKVAKDILAGGSVI